MILCLRRKESHSIPITTKISIHEGKHSQRLDIHIIRLHCVPASILDDGDHDLNHDPQGHNLNKYLDREELMALVLH